VLGTPAKNYFPRLHCGNKLRSRGRNWDSQKFARRNYCLRQIIRDSFEHYTENKHLSCMTLCAIVQTVLTRLDYDWTWRTNSWPIILTIYVRLPEPIRVLAVAQRVKILPRQFIGGVVQQFRYSEEHELQHFYYKVIIYRFVCFRKKTTRWNIL